MNPKFFEQPIINSPYKAPSRHWELDADGQPTHRLIESRRQVRFESPIPAPKKRGRGAQLDLAVGAARDDGAKIDLARVIQELRGEVVRWRRLRNPDQWQVTPETARLLQHWRREEGWSDIRPFFCQLEAVETAIWLTEAARRRRDRAGRRFLQRLEEVNAEYGGLPRLALKLATGAGKTMVMAMLIAWQTINAVRRPGSPYFSRGFLIVAPGLTIRDRLRVLQPNDPDNYYRRRGLVPSDMAADVDRAKIVVTNFHAFRRRERIALSKNARSLLRGRGGEDLDTLETEGQMLQRVLPELMGMKNIVVFNDEAHHCYREKPGDPDEAKPRGDDLRDAKANREAARVWISGLESVKRRLGLSRVFDLSATPFFLRGSGYAEGTLFPWTMSDFSLMDAIESGIVKLPRVPVADDLSGADVPMYRELWKHIGRKMPKGRRTARAAGLDPRSLPLPLQNALDALYGHYEKVFEAWAEADIVTPPCFIVVCNSTSTSKLLHDYISGYWKGEGEGAKFEHGRLELFRNFDERGKPLPRPRTLLIDSARLESGEGLDKAFRTAAADEIERFRREEMDRTGDLVKAGSLTDEDLLREVMNTVGKPGQLGGSIRCVVSVSMLTEGWDANTVTHILGVRAFGSQLLCEQVIGRALRRQSYELNERGFFDVEYADVFGVPFDFTAEPVAAGPPVVKPTIAVRAISPDRDHAEIRFPRVEGYRVELPEDRIDACFTKDSTLTLTPECVGATDTRNEALIGEGADIDVGHLEGYRRASLIFNLTVRLMETRFREPDGGLNHRLFGKLKRVVHRWLDAHLECRGGTVPAQLMYRQLTDMACERIHAAIVRSRKDDRPVLAVLDPFQPTGTTSDVHFVTSRRCYRTDPRFCHVDHAVLDSGWEGEFCRVVERMAGRTHGRVFAYVRNDRLGLEIPYRFGSTARRYLPDFIVLVDDGRGRDDPLQLLVEIKGLRGEDAKAKKEAAETWWVEGVNNLGSHGRWAFAEFTDISDLEAGFDRLVRRQMAEAASAA